MSTTTGNSKQIRVTDPSGNVWVMTMVDAEARQSIADAQEFNFDEDYFTAEETSTEVSIGLNGVPIGVDTDSPLEIVQDDENGIAFGSRAPFATAIAPQYDPESTYGMGEKVTNLGKYWRAKADIDPAEDWTPAHWDEIDVESQFDDVETALDEVNDILEDLTGTPGMTDLGNKTESDLVSGALTIGAGNSTTRLTLTQADELKVVSNAGVPNFALEIDNSGNSNDVEVTVTESDGTTGMKNSVAGGTTVTAGSYVQLTAVGRCWTMAEFEGGSLPTPTYNYILLNQFTSPMPATTDTDDFRIEVPSSWHDATYQTDDLVSSTPGDQMLDSDTPVDFSGKGIQTGTPCGIVDWDCCPGEMMPRYAITAGDLSNGATIEVWYKSDYSVQSDDSYPWLIAMDSTSNNYDIILSPETENGSGTAGHQMSLLFTVDDGSSYGTRYTYDQTMQDQWNDGNWHHYAITYDSTANEMYVFFDGTKVITVDDRTSDVQGLFAGANRLKFAQSNGTFIPEGRFAQIAVSDECKWTDDFTVPTVAY